MSLSAASSRLSEPPASAAEGAARTAALECALLRAQRGDRAAFAELIRAHQNGVYTLALRLLGVPQDAEELAQDAFVAAHRHLGKISSQAHLAFWLRRTVCHRAIDRLRRRPPHPAEPLESAETAERALSEPSRDPLLERYLRERVLRLPPAARVVILLRYQEDLDPPEIARVLGMPLNTVKSHLKRSLASLRSGCAGLRPPMSEESS